MTDHIKEVAKAMADRRLELINQPIARIWEELAKVALAKDKEIRASVHAATMAWLDELAENPPEPNESLKKLFAESKAKFDAMTPEQQSEHRELQRQSYVRAMTTGCEHGVLDFETCPQCRSNALGKHFRNHNI